MRRLGFALVAVAAVGLTACQRQTAPERAAEPAAPGSGATGAATSLESGPAEAPPTPAEAPAPSAASPARPAPDRASAAPPAAPAAPPAGGVVPPAPVAAKAPPAPAPPPPLVLAAGTELPLVIRTTVASNTSAAGDRVIAEIAQDIAADGRVVLPEGTEVIGRVTAAKGSGRVKGRARLAVAFQEVRVGGASYVLEASALDVTAGSSKGRDAKIVGGAAAAGAIIGAIADGGKGALKGGAIGGAAGGAAVLATKGDEVVFMAGENYTIQLKTRLQVD